MLDNAPDHHAGMFMVNVGDRRMLVGDPSLGKMIMATTTMPDLPGGPDFTAETQHRFDSVAAQCAAQGYQVTRLQYGYLAHGGEVGRGGAAAAADDAGAGG